MKDKITIKKLAYRKRFKELFLGNSLSYTLPNSTCVDKTSVIIKKGSELFVECENGESQIYPSYCKKDELTIGGFTIDLLIKEITDDDEFDSYESLAKYHYKGKSIFGRTSILIATNTTPYLPRVIGYIELATPFFVNRPRAEILNAPFQHNGIKWENWDVKTASKYINVITRIARCVVYPEFRGIGLGSKLIEHAEMFARERWQIKNLKPLFIEISADMLKFVQFASQAGMHFVGETQGNLNRVHKDLGYLLKNLSRIQSKEIISNHQMGMIEQQKARLRKAIKIANENGLTIEEFLNRIEKLQREKRLVDFTFFNGIISLPKPTYLKGLDEISENFIVNQLYNHQEVRRNFYDYFHTEIIQSPIELKNLDITFKSKVRLTEKSQSINNAFGISPKDIESTIFRGFKLTIEPGEVVLILGSSGAGKTTLLNLLSGDLAKNSNAAISGTMVYPLNYHPGTLQEIHSKKALIEYFGDEDVSYALTLMGKTGLSDAYVYLKRFDELSRGQQYRALISKVIHDRCNTLIVDEFCSNLDPITANVLAHRLRRLVKQLGITLIIGAPHCDFFIKSLNPDKVVRLSTAWDYEIKNGIEFVKQYAFKHHPLIYQRFKLKSEYFNLILQGGKKSTIRKFSDLFRLGYTLLESGNKVLPVYVFEITNRTLDELTIEDAKADGFHTLIDLKNFLTKTYEGITPDSPLAIISFTTSKFMRKKS